MNHLLGRDPPIGKQFLAAEVLVFADVVQPHSRAKQLAGVFVVRDDRHAVVQGRGLFGQRGQHVVGLPPRNRDDRHAERFDQLDNHRNLGLQRFRHLAAVCLVLGVPARPFARSVAFTRHHEVRGLLVLEDREQIPRDAKHRVRRLPIRRGHLRDRMKHLKHQGKQIDQHQMPGRTGRSCRTHATTS